MIFTSKNLQALFNKIKNSNIKRSNVLIKPNKSFNRKYSLLNPNLSTISDPDQHVIAGEGSLDEIAYGLKQKKWKPFIVTDQGLVKAGTMTTVRQIFLQAGLKFTVFSTIRGNPTVNDVKEISYAMSKSGCDCIVALGGGSAMDAAKASLLFLTKSDVGYSSAPKNFITPIVDHNKFFNSLKQDNSYDSFVLNMPPLYCVPTTAGTGSEGGKSAYIIYNNRKKVITHSSLLPQNVALDPRLTISMSPKLTFTTGIDALFHCIESYLIRDSDALALGLDEDDIEHCNNYAISGIKLILKNLPIVMKNPDNLLSRLYLQMGAFYGAKAFKKGELGGIHATAHALSDVFNIHHGEAVARMAVPVLTYNEQYADSETAQKIEHLLQLFRAAGIIEPTISSAVNNLITKGGVEFGLNGLDFSSKDIQKLCDLAIQDMFKLNPVPLNDISYRDIFHMASKKKMTKI